VIFAYFKQIAATINCHQSTTAAHLNKLKRRYLVDNVTWWDGRKVWVLTEEGAKRLDYHMKRDRGKQQTRVSDMK
jgi:Mn-dependent DtxR family transcriptional regulator